MGVIASDSRHVNGGALTADGCDKLTRHLDLCDLFHLPVLNLVDNPGFAVGIEHEKASTIRKGGRWMVAFAQTTVRETLASGHLRLGRYVFGPGPGMLAAAHGQLKSEYLDPVLRGEKRGAFAFTEPSGEGGGKPTWASSSMTR